jgi:hypothetical protein
MRHLDAPKWVVVTAIRHIDGRSFDGGQNHATGTRQYLTDAESIRMALERPGMCNPLLWVSRLKATTGKHRVGNIFHMSPTILNKLKTQIGFIGLGLMGACSHGDYMHLSGIKHGTALRRPWMNLANRG